MRPTKKPNHAKTAALVLVNDLLIYAPTLFNPYGHVAIVAEVQTNAIEIIQQNPGRWGHSRQRYQLSWENGQWLIHKKRILGWLRKKRKRHKEPSQTLSTPNSVPFVPSSFSLS